MTAPTATALRPQWDALPTGLRAGLADLLGGIAVADVQTGGFTPGLAARLRLATGRHLFAKGIPSDHALAGKYRTEADTARALPATTPAPRLQWTGEIAEWVVLIFDDIEGRHPDLSPGSPDVPRVVAAVAGLAEVLTPSPLPQAPDATAELAAIVHGWAELADAPPLDLDPWECAHVNRLAEMESHWLRAAAGPTLLHGDINASNLLIDGTGGVHLIDWAQPACGAAWIDIVDLIPHLILAGHDPAAAECAVADVPAWNGTDPEMITSYAVAFAGYWARTCRQPAPPMVPYLRGYQRRAAGAALDWVRHRTGW
ncbi:phosphotransferase [Sphaerisporangium sp. NPDC051011]|uniref:phosphotransferase n=1 Tax=Sphaerisporangium sp. NPDC051011 TaxID=3155792 RepID=UPI0033C25AFF